VAIADVAHYVTPGSSLDREALVRGIRSISPTASCRCCPSASRTICVAAAKGGPRGARRADGDRRRRAQAQPYVPSRADALGGKTALRAAQDAIDGRTDETTGPLLGSHPQAALRRLSSVQEAREVRQRLDLDLPERKIVLKGDGTVAASSPPRSTRTG